MSNFNGVIKRSVMRELNANVAAAMRTSSQTEAGNHDLDLQQQADESAMQVSEFGHSNPNHLEEPPRCESGDDKVQQINQ